MAVETTWRSKGGKGLRRPDVQATLGGLRIAFEAQLTTTFLDVVRGRRTFYLDDGALLVWVLRRFDPAYRRMTEDDVLFSNNSNTNIAMVHEAGHPEPWIIALSEPPTVHRAFDYGLRWGIEAMFSDFKTRGFGLEDSHIRIPKRLDHLILVMTLALYWAVSTGMWDAVNRPMPAEKNAPTNGQGITPGR